MAYRNHIYGGGRRTRQMPSYDDSDDNDFDPYGRQMNCGPPPRRGMGGGAYGGYSGYGGRGHGSRIQSGFRPGPCPEDFTAYYDSEEETVSVVFHTGPQPGGARRGAGGGMRRRPEADDIEEYYSSDGSFAAYRNLQPPDDSHQGIASSSNALVRRRGQRPNLDQQQSNAMFEDYSDEDEDDSQQDQAWVQRQMSRQSQGSRNPQGRQRGNNGDPATIIHSDSRFADF